MTVVVEYTAEPDRSGNVRLTRAVSYGKDGDSDINWHNFSFFAVDLSASDALDLAISCQDWINGEIYGEDFQSYPCVADPKTHICTMFSNGKTGKRGLLLWDDPTLPTYRCRDDLLSGYLGLFMNEIESAAKRAIDANKRRGELFK